MNKWHLYQLENLAEKRVSHSYPQSSKSPVNSVSQTSCFIASICEYVVFHLKPIDGAAIKKMLKQSKSLLQMMLKKKSISFEFNKITKGKT